MKFIYLKFVCLVFVSCSQKQNIIVKHCDFVGKDKSFSNYQNVVCGKFYFEYDTLKAKVNYSRNGWQVIDSIFIKNENGNYCELYFIPNYNGGYRKLSGYSFDKRECMETSKNLNLINSLDDKYRLSNEYIQNLNFLLTLNPEKEKELFRFNESVIPSIFLNYGIPVNEALQYFSYNINSNKIVDDMFCFDRYIVKRSYYYDKQGMLKKVYILVENKEENVKLKYYETYEEGDY